MTTHGLHGLKLSCLSRDDTCMREAVIWVFHD